MTLIVLLAINGQCHLLSAACVVIQRSNIRFHNFNNQLELITMRVYQELLHTHEKIIWLPCWWASAHDPEVLVPFSGGATGALQVGHVCCRSNHERRHCTWNRCPQLSLFAVVISSRQMMQVASLLNDYHLSVTYHKSNGIQIIRTHTSKGWTTHVFSSSGVASGKRSSILEVIFR